MAPGGYLTGTVNSWPPEPDGRFVGGPGRASGGYGEILGPLELDRGFVSGPGIVSGGYDIRSHDHLPS